MQREEGILVLDVGTTSVRAQVVSLATGVSLAAGGRKNTWVRNGPFSELSPEGIWQNAQQSVQDVVGTLPAGVRILAISFSFMGDTLLPADEHLAPLGNIIMAFDTRARKEAAYIEREAGREYFARAIGGPCLSMLVGSKILWLRNNASELYAKARYFLNVQQYILGRLGLPLATDYTLAGRKALYHVQEKHWDEKLLRIVGATPEQLGTEVLESTTVIGHLESFGQVRLPERLPVILGAHDSECGYLGLGIQPSGDSALGNVSGTYEMMGSFTGEYLQGYEGSLVEVGCGLLRDSLSISGSSIAGSYLEWYRDRIYPGNKADFHEDLEAQADYTGEGDAFFLVDNDQAHFDLAGLDTGSNHQDIYRTLQEGICFKLKRIVNKMEELHECPFSAIRCGGGSARSHKLLQFKADLLQREVGLVRNLEVSSLGAAILGGVGLSYYGGFKEATGRMVRLERVFRPRAREGHAYQRKFERYQTYMERWK